MMNSVTIKRPPRIFDEDGKYFIITGNGKKKKFTKQRAKKYMIVKKHKAIIDRTKARDIQQIIGSRLDSSYVNNRNLINQMHNQPQYNIGVSALPYIMENANLKFDTLKTSIDNQKNVITQIAKKSDDVEKKINDLSVIPQSNENENMIEESKIFDVLQPENKKKIEDWAELYGLSAENLLDSVYEKIYDKIPIIKIDDKTPEPKFSTIKKNNAILSNNLVNFIKRTFGKDPNVMPSDLGYTAQEGKDLINSIKAKINSKAGKIGYGSNIRDADGTSSNELLLLMNPYRRLTNFLGVCCSDQIYDLLEKNNNLDKFSLIFNTLTSSDDVTNPGHWIAIYSDGMSLEYYDALTEEIDNNVIDQLTTFIQNNYQHYLKFKINKVKQQSNFSSHCGEECCRFIICRGAFGIPFSTLTGWKPKKYEDDDVVLENFNKNSIDHKKFDFV